MKRQMLGDPWRTREDGSLFLRSVLGLVGLFRGPLQAAGVDYPIFRELLRTRVVMDLRPTGPVSRFGAAGLVLSVLMTWLMGLFAGVLAITSEDTGLWLVVSQALLSFLLLMFLFQHMAGTLVDPTDIRAVAPHPVPDRTLFAVRLVTVFAYLALLALAFTAGNVFLALFAKPVLPVLLVVPVFSILNTIATLGFVSLLFTATLRLVGPTYFQRVTLWLQVLSAVLLMSGIQVAPHFVPPEKWRELWESASAWKMLVPPFQYVKVFALAAGERSDGDLLALGAMLLLPALALYATLVLASRNYLAGLEGSLEVSSKVRAPWSRGVLTRLGPLFARKREQRAGFDFALALCRREVHVVRGALPQFASMQLMAVGMGLGRMHRHAEDAAFVSSYYLCFSAGVLTVLVPMLLEFTQGSASSDASWIFLAAPLSDESELLRGALKGILLAWYGFALAVVACVQLAIVGPGELPRVALALELSLIVALAYTRWFSLGIPFTRPVRKMEGIQNVGIVLTMFFALGLLAGVFWLLTRHRAVLAGGIVGCAVLIVVLWRGLDRMKVAKMRRLAG